MTRRPPSLRAPHPSLHGLDAGARLGCRYCCLKVGGRPKGVSTTNNRRDAVSATAHETAGLAR